MVPFIALCAIAPGVFAQKAGAPQPATTQQYDMSDYSKYNHEVRTEAGLFFREAWKRYPAPMEHPPTQGNVSNPSLELKVYGPSANQIVIGGDPALPSNPPHLWTGMCEQTCAAALRDKNNFVDLSGFGKIRWLVKVSGVHRVHPIVKLADGTWLLGEHEDGNVADLLQSEFTLSEWRWIKLDIDKVITVGRWLDKVDLSRVDEVGFTDLMRGSGHGDGGYTDMGWIEVYGKPVPRAGN
jgi:hypothetical protein